MPRYAPAVGLILLLGCATQPVATPPPTTPTPVPAPAPPSTPASALVDRLGDSPETAVEVPADAPNEGADFENNWIYDRFGRFRRLGGGLAHAGEGPAERRYDVVKFELPDHSEHTVYFDITEMWKKWKPSR